MHAIAARREGRMRASITHKTYIQDITHTMISRALPAHTNTNSCLFLINPYKSSPPPFSLAQVINLYRHGLSYVYYMYLSVELKTAHDRKTSSRARSEAKVIIYKVSNM